MGEGLPDREGGDPLQKLQSGTAYPSHPVLAGVWLWPASWQLLWLQEQTCRKQGNREPGSQAQMTPKSAAGTFGCQRRWTGHICTQRLRRVAERMSYVMHERHI